MHILTRAGVRCHSGMAFRFECAGVCSHGMPGFAGQLDDAQAAAVVNWVRTNLGNAYADDPATAEGVKALRQ